MGSKSIDVGDIAKWIDDEVELTEELTTNVAKKTALDIMAAVVVPTPTDTGQARAGWLISTGSRTDAAPSREEFEAHQGDGIPPKMEGEEVISRASDAVEGAEFGQVIFVQNNVGHIVFLNEGSSIQAPSKFVDMAVSNVLGGF